MSEFHKEENHGRAFALLFDTHKIEHKFKQSTDLPYTVIKDKEEQRICAMLNSAGELGATFRQHQLAAVSAVAFAGSIGEALDIQMGLTKLVPRGIAICPTCLANAIKLCEENLIVLKDIQEATKQYATNY